MATGLTPADFGRDPTAVFVKILQDAREPLTARRIIDAVAGYGVPRPTVRAKWKVFQDKVVKDFTAKGLAVTAAEVRAKMDELMAQAVAQVKAGT